jgi:hypothetical protein
MIMAIRKFINYSALKINYPDFKTPKIYKLYFQKYKYKMTDYNPTKKEVLGEVFNGLGRFSMENVYSFGRGLKKFSVNTGKGLKNFADNTTDCFLEVMASPYVIPTTIRVTVNYDVSDVDLSKIPISERMGAYTGLAGGVVSSIIYGMGYHHIATEMDHPEVLLIPLATNFVSGVGEIGRGLAKNAKQRLLKRHRFEGIESTVDAADSEQE